jgi:hypothetical protein
MVRFDRQAAVTIFLSMTFGILACKARRDEASSSKSIVTESGGKYIVFAGDNINAKKIECSDVAKLTDLSKCQVLAAKTWPEFTKNLRAQGIPADKAFDIQQEMLNPGLLDGRDAALKQFVDAMDKALTGTSSTGPTSPGVFSKPFAIGSTASPSITGTPPSGTDNRMARDEVLKAMVQIRSTYNVNKSTIQACLDNNVLKWSDIVIHYYCQLPGQNPDMRMCFTYSVQGISPYMKRTYEEAYDFCVYDGNAGSTATTYNTSMMNGPLKWVAENQGNVFKYIMFSEVNTFSALDQQKVINKFYDVDNPKNTSDCQKRMKRKNNSSPFGAHCYGGVNIVAESVYDSDGAVNPPVTPPVTPPTSPGVSKVSVTSDGTLKKPHCSWGSSCTWDQSSQGRCAMYLCINSGYSQGEFVSATNDMCASSFTSGSMYYVDYGTGEVKNGSTTNEAGITADCWIPAGANIVISDGTQKKPHCSWGSTCTWDQNSMDSCAKHLCKASGFSSGKFISATNNMCTTSMTSSSMFYVDYVSGEVKNGSTSNEAGIVADCQ